MTDNHNHFVYSNEVLDFVSKANSFVNFCEGSHASLFEQNVSGLLVHLSQVYSSFLLIPVNESYFDDGNEKFVTEAEWSAVFQSVAEAIGPYNEYADLADEEEFDRSELTSRKISEDVADVYQDIRDFLEVYRIGTEEVMNDAIWECRQSFENYWGIKAVRAMKALHLAWQRILKGEEQRVDSKKVNTKINTDNWFISMRQKEMGDDGRLFE